MPQHYGWTGLYLKKGLLTSRMQEGVQAITWYLRGTTVLYFQYWVVFPHRTFRTPTNVRADILAASAHPSTPIAPISRLLVAPFTEDTVSRSLACTMAYSDWGVR